MRIYCDMDGVLVDWVSGMLKLANNILQKPAEEVRSKKLRKYAQRIKEGLGRDYIKADEFKVKQPPVKPFTYASIMRDPFFWIELNELDGNIAKLWNPLREMAAEHDIEVEILSSPIESDPKCVPQKVEWCKIHLGIGPEKVKVVSNKSVYAKDADGSKNMLIDDTEKKLNEWSEGGGIPIRFKDNPGEVLERVKELLEERTLVGRMKDLSDV